MPSRKSAASGPPAEDEELDVALIILRAALRWKQNDLARESGIGNSSISDYERRKKAPGRKNLRKILEAMGYRESVLELTRWFLNELRTTQRLAPGESLDATAETAALAEMGLRARVDQVTGEVGRTSEHLIRLMLELLMARGGGPSGDDGG
ncbi:MAG: helix-turn-helix protein [Acidobacteriota bacterium]|jgi:transcriptional regulator with XRE-family HTH domain|nr:helix-turn-helix protein [Acidobacteriota bacterium]